MLRGGSCAFLSFVTGLAVGAFWSKYDRPKLGNFQEPEGVLEYRTIRDESDPAKGSTATNQDKSRRTKVARRDDRSKPEVPEYMKRLYRTVGNDGRLTWGVRDLAGLSDATAAKVQAPIDDAFAEFAMQAKQNLKQVSKGSPPDGVGAVFEMKAFPEVGVRIWETVRQRMKETAGNQGAEFLIAAFNPEEQMGFLGRYDYKFTILPATRFSEVPRIQIDAFDPQTGKLMDQGVSKNNDLRYWMRGLLDSNETSGTNP
jgi:hypothetical protein